MTNGYSSFEIPIFCNSYTLPYQTAILMIPIADYTLDEYLGQDRENVQEELLWTLFGCLASILHFLHISFIWHKDIKPYHVLLKKEKIVLVGFGYALEWSDLAHDQESGPPDAMTRRYAAPEVISCEERSSLTDVWSLGCVFLEIWTVLNGESLEDMKGYLESGTDNLSCYADNLERIDLWITHLQELSDNKVDKAPAEWIRNMLTPDQQARWSARTLLDTINQYGGRFIGECCRVRGNTQETSETYDTAESDPVSQERVWTDLDQGTKDNMAEGKPSTAEQIASASYSTTQKHPSLPHHALHVTTSRPPSHDNPNELDLISPPVPGVNRIATSSTEQPQSTSAFLETLAIRRQPTNKPGPLETSGRHSTIESPLRRQPTFEPAPGRSRVRRWFDKAGAYITGTDQEGHNNNKKKYEYDRVTTPPGIQNSERPKGEGLSTPMPRSVRDDQERFESEYLAGLADERDKMRRNREEMERKEAERLIKLRDELRRERDELRHELDPRPRDGNKHTVRGEHKD
jgi:serine/threonine protein kinase